VLLSLSLVFAEATRSGGGGGGGVGDGAGASGGADAGAAGADRGSIDGAGVFVVACAGRTPLASAALLANRASAASESARREASQTSSRIPLALSVYIYSALCRAYCSCFYGLVLMEPPMKLPAPFEGT
jgi:hypothetical protein